MFIVPASYESDSYGATLPGRCHCEAARLAPVRQIGPAPGLALAACGRPTCDHSNPATACGEAPWRHGPVRRFNCSCTESHTLCFKSLIPGAQAACLVRRRGTSPGWSATPAPAARPRPAPICARERPVFVRAARRAQVQARCRA